ncbi:unnamed protein product [Microthlaspi erraticum]|uniref:Jacalin-type lectin domain-containing protein n=1 Tax=Microthlaspi erraticum TaxID=1685480 RepID=A0A6D2HXW4_9BRAS|nr:unnamed protein product [Microthlaspi erraticum]
MALIVEPTSGKGGNEWDDGSDYENVTKIHVRGGLEGIQFIKFEYVKDGKMIVGQIHGVSGRGMTQTLEINHSDKEYLLSVEGQYDESTGVIQSIQFTTNKNISDILGLYDGTKFSLKETGKKIIGFHGFSEKHLNSLGAYFIKHPPIKSKTEGAENTGIVFDDGGDYDGVRKVYVRYDNTVIRQIKFDYDKAGKVEYGRGHGEDTGKHYEFNVDYPSEYLISVEGTYAITHPYGTKILRSLTFKTSKGRTSGVIGKPTGSFLLQSEGNAIVGFHGRHGGSLDGIGAYYTPLNSSPLEKKEAQGGKGGNHWDDGFGYESVTKIHVRGGLKGIQLIKFEYAKEGKTIVGPTHGVASRGFTQTFEINHSDEEYLLSVDGYYDESTGVIQSIQFTTNKNISEMMGFHDGTAFSLRATGKKIIGFHGFSEKNLNSLGAYFIKHPRIISEIGGAKTTGNVFDDGGDYDGITKVYVRYDNSVIRQIKIDYVKAGKVESREYGNNTEKHNEMQFKVDYPSEYITSVEGTYALTNPYQSDIIRSLTFKTSKGRTSGVMGKPTGSFMLHSEGNAIVGFHGRCGGSVDGIGVYYSSLA